MSVGVGAGVRSGIEAEALLGVRARAYPSATISAQPSS